MSLTFLPDDLDLAGVGHSEGDGVQFNVELEAHLLGAKFLHEAGHDFVTIKI